MSNENAKNVQEYRRQHLEREIAALSMAVDDDDEENPTLIINIDDPKAKGAIKRVIIWIGGLVGGAVEWSRRSAKRQVVLAVAGTAAAATAAAVVTEITRESPRLTPAPVLAQQTVTLPPEPATTVTATVRPTPKPSRKPTRRDDGGTGHVPAQGVEPRAQPNQSTAEQARSSPRPTPQPPRSRPRPQPTPVSERPSVSAESAEEVGERPETLRSDNPDVQDDQEERDEPARTPPPSRDDGPEPDPDPEPSSEPEPEPEPEQSGPEPGRDCGIEVNLPPILDLCVLH